MLNEVSNLYQIRLKDQPMFQEQRRIGSSRESHNSQKMSLVNLSAGFKNNHEYLK